MKTYQFLLVITYLFLFSNNIFCQLKVDQYGSVSINSSGSQAFTINGSSIFKVSQFGDLSTFGSIEAFQKIEAYNEIISHNYVYAFNGLYSLSDGNFKHNITPINSALVKIKKLNGVKFQYNDIESKILKSNRLPDSNRVESFHLGLIAQDVEKIFPEIVKIMDDSVKAIAYSELIPVLIEALKEQQNQIETLQTIVFSQEQEIVELKKAVESFCSENKSKLKKAITQVDIKESGILNAKLYENIPNPFSQNTEIKFDIPENSTSAKLIITDLQGIELKSYLIHEKGAGSIIINGNELKAGLFLYVLLVDNQIIDTKKMILTKD